MRKRKSNLSEQKKIKQLKRIGVKYQTLWRGKTLSEIRKEMKKRGFQVKRSSGIAFIKKTFVIKIAAILSGYKSKYQIPSFISELQEINTKSLPRGFNFKFICQPRADTRKRKAAEEILTGKLKNRFSDVHEDNCAFYKGNPVLIDW